MTLLSHSFKCIHRYIYVIEQLATFNAVLDINLVKTAETRRVSIHGASTAES